MVMPEERRRLVDRRRGSERRSTLDRRGRAARTSNGERPVEHVRNALQLLREVALVGELSSGPSEDLGAAIERLHRAVGLLERQRREGGRQARPPPFFFKRARSSPKPPPCKHLA